MDVKPTMYAGPMDVKPSISSMDLKPVPNGLSLEDRIFYATGGKRTKRKHVAYNKIASPKKLRSSTKTAITSGATVKSRMTAPSLPKAPSLAKAQPLAKAAPLARDNAKKTKRKSVPIPTIVKEDLDLDAYQLDRIHKMKISRLTPNRLEYWVSWEGYPASENGFEPEASFISFNIVRDYWARQLESSRGKNFKYRDVAQGCLLQNELQQGDLRFVSCEDDISIKELLIKRIGKTADWKYMVISWRKEDSRCKSYGHFLGSYDYSLRVIARSLSFYPIIQTDNVIDYALPMPLRSMLFHNALPEEDIFDMNDGQLNEDLQYDPEYEYYKEVKNVRDCGDCLLGMREIGRLVGRKSRIKVDPTHMANANEAAHARHLPIDTSVHSRVPEENEVLAKQRVRLTLARHPDKYWYLESIQGIPKGQPIMPICGEYVDDSLAEECLRSEGEMVAFLMFIQLPNGKCLDRRRRADLSRYLSHSCHPNCSIRLEYPNDDETLVPVLVLYANRRIGRGETLTIDKMRGFTRSDPSEHGLLVEKACDHVVCLCEENDCQRVLWTEEHPTMSMEQLVTMKKSEKLRRMRFGRFRGVRLWTDEIPLDVNEPEDEDEEEEEDSENQQPEQAEDGEDEYD